MLLTIHLCLLFKKKKEEYSEDYFVHRFCYFLISMPGIKRVNAPTSLSIVIITR